MQRLHVDDLVGHVRDKDDWTLLNMPAIAEQELTYEIRHGEHYTRRAGEVLHGAREDLRTLKVIKHQLSTAAFDAQHQQRPVPPGTTLRNAIRCRNLRRRDHGSFGFAHTGERDLILLVWIRWSAFIQLGRMDGIHPNC
jgi:hypothetical protein